jgi:hypothetical protein
MCMKKSNTRRYCLHFLKFGAIPWFILTVGRYLYEYGFHFGQINQDFVVTSILTLLVLSGLSLSSMAENKKRNEKKAL